MLKPCVICLNLASQIVEGDYDYIGVDKGSLFLAKNNIRMIKAIGDFDSINDEEKELVKQYSNSILKLDTHKNESDSFVALDYAKKEGYQKIIVVGAFGKRFDHSYVNQNLLLANEDIDLTFIDGNNKIKVLKRGTYNILKKDYKYLSVFALEPSVVTYKGLEYPLSNYLMTPDDYIGLSNEIISEMGIVTISQGKVLLIQSKD